MICYWLSTGCIALYIPNGWKHFSRGKAKGSGPTIVYDVTASWPSVDASRSTSVLATSDEPCQLLRFRPADETQQGPSVFEGANLGLRHVHSSGVMYLATGTA